MKKVISLYLMIVSTIISAKAQSHYPCGFDIVHQRQLTLDSNYKRSVSQLNDRWIKYSTLLSSALLTYTSSGYVYEIPMVVHVLHTGGSVGTTYNPDSTKIAQMVEYLNKSYAATSPFPDTSSGGCRIPLKFVLAKRTPTGASTNGIVRKDASGISGYTTYGVNAATTSGVDASTIAAFSRWDPVSYYNVYCVNKIDGNDLTSTGGIAGFAYFPGSPTLDGMYVVASQVKSGSTTVSHEFGHAFSLYHTFEGDSGGTSCPSSTSCSSTGDLVCDTEPHIRESSAYPSTWCPPSGATNPCTGVAYNNVQYNIMDYTNCPPNRFTAGQRTRVLNTLDNERTGFKTSLGLQDPTSSVTTACVPTSTTPGYPVGPYIVKFNDLEVWSGSCGDEDTCYVDHSYTQQSFVEKGSSYTISVTTKTNAQNVKVFIDYNNDGDFSDAGENVYSHGYTVASGTEVHTGSITIPSTATTCAFLRMRVVAEFGGASVSDYACGPYAYGQAEDYAIYIKADKPTVSTPVNLCTGATASALSATGTNLKWYTSDTGGTGSTTAPTPSTASAGTTIYYVSQSTDGTSTCEGKRAAITVNVGASMSAPTVSSPVNYCVGASSTTLSATGINLRWYTTASGGTPSTTAPTPSTASAGSTTYYVSQSSDTSGTCESTRAAITVNINSVPAAPTVSSPISYCQGATATALSATKPSSSDTLYWYTVASGGTGSTTAPTPSTASAGSTTYYVSAKSSGSCEGPRASITVNVNALPTAPSVSSPISYCQGETAISLSATKPSSTDTLYWYTTATGGTGTTLSPTPSTASAGSTTYYVSAKNTNNCEGPRASITVNINALPTAPSVSTPINYCVGASASALTATKPTSTDTLYWYTTATGGTGSSTAPTPSTASAGSSTYYVSAKNTNNCEGPRASITVTVNSVPAAPSVSSPVNLCQGTTASALSASGSSLLWYTSATGGTGSSTAPTPSTASTGTTTYYVSQTITCEGPRDSIIVNVNPSPSKPTVSSPLSYCQGETATVLSATKPSSTDTLYWYNTASGGTGSTSAPTPSTASSGTTTFYVGAKNTDACEGPRDSIIVNINPTPSAPTVSSPVNYCLGATASTLTATKPSSTDTLYWYTSATGGTASTTAPTPSTASAGTSTYYVSAKNTSNCEGPRASITVNVNSTPTAPTVSSPLNLCQGATATALTASGADLLWYTTATGGTGSSTAPTPSTASTGTTTYYVSQTVGCESPRDSIVVYVNSVPSSPTVSSPISYCQGATATALSAAKPSSTDTLYWYTVATGGTGSTTALTPSTASAGTNTYYVSAKNTNACEGPRDSITVNINALPTSPGVSSPVNYCIGASASALSATKPSSTDTLYWYTSATGGTGSTTAPTPVTASAGTTTYYVSAKNTNNCEGPRASIAVNINALPASPTVSSPLSLCQGYTASALTATKPSSTDTLYWYTTATGGTGSITAPTPSTATAGTTTYYVSTKNTNACEGPRDSISVVVNTLPAAPTVSSPLSYCQGATASALTATKPSTTDTLYWYTTATGGTGSTTAPTPNTASVGTTTYYVSAKNTNACEGPRDSIIININALPVAPTVSSPINYCQGATASTLTATKPTATDTLYWYTTATGGTGSTTAPTPSTASAGTTTYYVSAKNTNTCEGPRASITVNINALPLAPTVSSPLNLCQGYTASALTATKPTATDTLYWYTTATGGTGSTTAPTPNTASAGTTTYYVSAKNTNACEGPRASISVVVNTLPAAPTVSSPISYCKDAVASALTATKPSTTDTLYWYTTATGGTGSMTAPTPSTASAGTTTYYVSAKNTNACEGPRDSIKVVINALPAAPTVSSPVTYCQGATATALTASKPSASDTLYWYTSASGGTGSTTAPTPSTASAGTTTYYVSAKNTNTCEGPRASINVIINALPTAPTVSSPINYCQGATATALSATGSSLLWYTAATGGIGSTTAPTPSTASVGSTTYYVSQTNTSTGCEGPRASITVNVNSLPTAPAVSSLVKYCVGATASVLSATKPSATDTLYWYTTATGGTGSITAPTPNTSSVGITNYYVSAKNVNACEGPRASITVVINSLPAAPTVSSPVTYCKGTTASALSATKPSATDTLYWYTTATGGTGSTTAPTPSTASAGTTTYYVSAKNTNTCEGPRDSITVVVNALPAAPTVSSPVNLCIGGSSAALSATKPSATDTLYWYTTATGGTGSTTAPTPSTASAGTTTYYVSAKNTNTCEGPRASISVVVNALPSAPTVSSPLYLCQGATAAALTATGTNLKWYTVATGGTGSTTAPTPSTASTGSTNYYVSQSLAASLGGCEGARATLTVTVNALPSVPSVTTPVTYCQNTTASALTATGTNLKWYSTATGGTGSSTAPTPSTTTAGSTTYYVSQSLASSMGGCEGPRAGITVVINPAPSAPTVTSAIAYCKGATASPLSATGTGLLWYTTATGGTGSSTAPTPSTASAGTTTYYVTQTNSTTACESPRASITVTINALPSAPTVTSPVNLCLGGGSATLSASGTGLLWYTAATGGTGSTTAPTPSTASLGTTTYYVTQTNSSTGCESPRASISVVINPLPSAPTVSTPLNLCIGGSATALTATGSNLKWYNAASGGSGSSTAPTPSTASLGTTTYYVSQTTAASSGSCEGPRASIDVVVQPLPLVSISSLTLSGFVVCRYHSITLKANSATATAYAWSKGGSLISGAADDTLVVDTSGYWSVEVTDVYGCKNTDEVYTSIDSIYSSLSPTEAIICEEGGVLLTCNPGYVDYTFNWIKDGLPWTPSTPLSNLRTATTPGVYHVIVTNDHYCLDTTNTTIVSLYPKPFKPTITNLYPLLSIPDIYLYYQWYRNGVKIVGANSHLYTVMSSGDYHVQVTDDKGCINESDTLQITSTTNIGNVLSQDEIKLYPNPTNDVVYIEAPIHVNIKVTDIRGRVVFEGKSVKSIDLQDYADGAYFLRISDENNRTIGIRKVHKITR